MEGYQSQDLLRLRSHVDKAFNSLNICPTAIEADTKWFKLMVHGVSRLDFRGENGMEALKEEIERFNPKITLVSLPRWLKRPEDMEGQAYSSAVIAVCTQEAQEAATKGIWVNGLKRRTSPFLTARPFDQCIQCNHFGHHWKRCKNQAC